MMDAPLFQGGGRRGGRGRGRGGRGGGRGGHNQGGGGPNQGGGEEEEPPAPGTDIDNVGGGGGGGGGQQKSPKGGGKRKFQFYCEVKKLVVVNVVVEEKWYLCICDILQEKAFCMCSLVFSLFK